MSAVSPLLTDGRQTADLAPLTSLRFIAALAIVILHMQGRQFIPMPSHAALGLGVSFFFVLSGFILSHVYGRMENVSTVDYLRNRLARIWPLHAVTFVLAAVLLWSGPLANPQWQQVAAINLFLLHGWIPLAGLPFSVNGVSWSISAELGFYLLFPLLARGKRWWMAVPLLALAYFGIFHWMLQVGPDLMGAQSHVPLWHFSAQHLLQQSPLMRCLEFAVGVAVQRSLHREGVAAWINLWPGLWEFTAASSVLLFAYYSQRLICDNAKGCNPYFGAWLSQSGGMVLFALFVLVMASSRGFLSRVLSHRLPVLLGEISFATYMVHHIVLKLADAHGLAESLHWTANVALLLGVIYGSSYLLWRGVEVPSRRWLGTSLNSRVRTGML